MSQNYVYRLVICNFRKINRIRNYFTQNPIQNSVQNPQLFRYRIRRYFVQNSIQNSQLFCTESCTESTIILYEILYKDYIKLHKNYIKII